MREILKTIYDEAIEVAFPLEYRYVSPEDPWLSMAYGEEPHATISYIGQPSRTINLISIVSNQFLENMVEDLIGARCIALVTMS